ncbi:hypothetical protein F5Y19DRAFT_466119 [Xylariaceae sp. FL1651]|nr:hypothetical protein F5Y19DRAFT_466119 [Xylariaceae sp. FL1651]
MCGVCQRLVRTWKCVQCDDFFCDECWPKERPHRPGKVGIDGRPHEKVDEEVISRLKLTFTQPTKEEQERRHEFDINTTWFGVAKEANQPFLHHSNRLVDIMQEHPTPYHPADRFPHLVSFVGQTGDGKSTVIKLLVNREQAHNRDRNLSYPVPVPGLESDTISTTGNVHLYSDPGTSIDQNPILYADCEGMTGGENTPKGLVVHENIEATRKPAKLTKSQIRRKIPWATDPKKQSREYAVTNLFPRILYTFSDAVVFVLKEVRRFETVVLQQLINWAATSIDKSINQPNLPHLIIVLNASEVNIGDDQWDPEQATRSLLDDYKDSVRLVPALQSVVASLGIQGNTIHTTKQLLEYYYSSVTVIRIPTKGRYMQIDEQVGRLQQIINNKCAESYAHKKSIRMSLNAERLPRYVMAAYDHFLLRLDEPFNFVEVARRYTPMPRDFGGHILNLILSIYKTGTMKTGILFKKLCQPLASCVILAATRDKTQGSYSDLLRNTYADPIRAAFNVFVSSWLRCSFKSGEYQCVNVQHTHKKGHQAHTGKILAKGNYQSEFADQEFLDNWISGIDESIKQLNSRLQKTMGGQNRDESFHVTLLHREILASFYQTGNLPDFKSNTTCLSCVRMLPEHVLPCGHVLCKTCIQAFGRDEGQDLFKLDNCPLHPAKTRWPHPIRIQFKPCDAGVRILCLDGGGVRGIVELVILKALEEKLGNYVPIQNFFDLIVGTSTGGIIALGIGVKRWSVEHCTSLFKELCQQAFTPRVFKKNESLQEAFDDNSTLFGGPKTESATAIRVAVTSTIAGEDRPVILTNYNTGVAERDKLSYSLIRPSDLSTEFKIWQAARATAAAPLYFKPFIQPKTNIAYTDGGIHYNCPALIADSERTLLWEDTRGMLPDILLSLGTGLHANASKPQSFQLNPHEISEKRLPKAPTNRGAVSGLRYMARIAHNILDSRTNCEEIWHNYHARAVPPSNVYRAEDRRRNMRINVELPGEWPKLDKVNAVESMESHVAKVVRERDDIRADIQEVADRLISSCFYFERYGPVYRNRVNGGYSCQGIIRCRFEKGSSDLKGLGKLFQDHISGDFVPCFLLQENYGSRDQIEHEVLIPTETIDRMSSRGSFELFPNSLQIDSISQSSMTRISLCLYPSDYRYATDNYRENKVLYSISGFPRQLCAQDVRLSPETSEYSGESRAEQSAAPKLKKSNTEPESRKLLTKASFLLNRRYKADQNLDSSDRPNLPLNRFSDSQISERRRTSYETWSINEMPVRSNDNEDDG